jgi:hypothetical protein
MKDEEPAKEYLAIPTGPFTLSRRKLPGPENAG